VHNTQTGAYLIKLSEREAECSMQYEMHKLLVRYAIRRELCGQLVGDTRTPSSVRLLLVVPAGAPDWTAGVALSSSGKKQKKQPVRVTPRVPPFRSEPHDTDLGLDIVKELRVTQLHHFQLVMYKSLRHRQDVSGAYLQHYMRASVAIPQMRTIV
jgi:hypothetical protein